MEDHLAGPVLTVVAGMAMPETLSLRDEFLAELHAAAISPSTPPLAPLILRMKAAGIDAADVADRFIPAIARSLGMMWCDDNIGFATVTIGVARLQGLLREIGPEWQADRHADGDAPGLLVVVGADVFHTLGAMVLTGQLRRRGLSVRLLFGATPDILGPILRQARFDAVLISASDGESLEALRRLVTTAKTATSVPPPVVIGGTVLDQAADGLIDIAALTGADFVTCDLDEALRLCGVEPDVVSGTPTGYGA
jgi:hypothetical protein